MQLTRKLLAFFMLFLGLSFPAHAQLSLTTPSFALSGVKTEIQVEGLDLEDAQPALYKVEINGAVASSGVAQKRSCKNSA